MNIAIFSPSKNPYSETFIQTHKKLLAGDIYYYYGVLPRINLEDEVSLVSKWQYLFLRLKRKIYKKSYRFISEQALIISLKKKKIQVLLIEYGNHAYDLISVIKQSKIPCIVHFHGYDASVLKVISRCKGYGEVFEIASKIIVVSNEMKRKIVELGCEEKKVYYTVCGPQPEFFQVVPKFTKQQFLGIGRFTEKKAQYYTILAFKEVVKKYPDARLILGGNGQLLEVCKNLAKYHNIEKQVDFLGVINHDEFRQLLQESLAFVQHSITALNGDMEGTPVSIMEASIAGLPVISTIHAGIPDVILDNVTGLLCEEHDVKTMANNMLKVLQDFNYARGLGLKGKDHISRYCSLDKHIKLLNKLVLEAAGDQKTL